MGGAFFCNRGGFWDTTVYRVETPPPSLTLLTLYGHFMGFFTGNLRGLTFYWKFMGNLWDHDHIR